MHALHLRRPSDLYAVTDLPEGTRYDELVALRAQRVPLQHLVGSVGFRWLDLEVGPGVFVPRPETELVVQAVIDELATPLGIPNRLDTPLDAPLGIPNGAEEAPKEGWGSPRGPVVVDLCTGSGAIALSVAHEVGGAVVHAVELDPVALSWARRNDDEGRVRFHEGPVEGCLPELDGTVDVVVSNPPYVPEGTAVDRETAEHDPALALWGGPDGLAVIRQVEAAARRLLRPGGLLVMEHDVTQGESVPALLQQAGGWVEVADHEDLTRRPRYVTARWQP